MLYGLLAIVIMGALFLVAVNLLPAGEQIAPSVRDEAPWNLPMSRPLDATDIASLRLPVSLRGYRFAETDVLLDRLSEELRARDAEIARLRGDPVPGSSLAVGSGTQFFKPPAVADSAEADDAPWANDAVPADDATGTGNASTAGDVAAPDEPFPVEGPSRAEDPDGA